MIHILYRCIDLEASLVLSLLYLIFYLSIHLFLPSSVCSVVVCLFLLFFFHSLINFVCVQLINHSFVRSFVRSFVCSFVHLFVCSFVRFGHSFIHLFFGLIINHE